MEFYNRTMTITSFAGIGRLPEISIPVADIDGIPIFVSLTAGNYQDEFLMSAAKQIFNEVVQVWDGTLGRNQTLIIVL
ncbi:MAG: hypothetical protein H8D87_21325 [Deltaproteobacteria bacterium]|uniref:hypothetical protein n=1 Tax=Desulfobacula sp. TaxID=2593537 RepID=UPI0019B82CF8|nr:hypothetical protein [Candidatus Desulfobacula maris]MBL6996058.1 hypothetical protein [Desulfobacula sp.]